MSSRLGINNSFLRPLQNGTFCPISASGSNFNPRNIQYITVVEIFAFLELEQKLPFIKGLFLLQLMNLQKTANKAKKEFWNSFWSLAVMLSQSSMK